MAVGSGNSRLVGGSAQPVLEYDAWKLGRPHLLMAAVSLMHAMMTACVAFLDVLCFVQLPACLHDPDAGVLQTK